MATSSIPGFVNQAKQLNPGPHPEHRLNKARTAVRVCSTYQIQDDTGCTPTRSSTRHSSLREADASELSGDLPLRTVADNRHGKVDKLADSICVWPRSSHRYSFWLSVRNSERLSNSAGDLMDLLEGDSGLYSLFGIAHHPLT